MLTPGESRLWVYERNSDRVFRNVPKNLACKRAYYTVSRKDGVEEDQLEKLFGAEVEGPGIAVIRRLSRESKQLHWEERMQATALIAFQELRVPYMREQLARMMKGLLKGFMNSAIGVPGMLEKDINKLQCEGKVSDAITAEDLRKVVREGGIDIVMKPEASLMAMGHAVKTLMTTYAELKWEVLIAREGEFVTSDCPVCRDYPISGNGPVGLANPDLNVYFPITHVRTLRLHHDRPKIERLARLMGFGREREAIRLRERTPEIAFRFIGGKEVSAINSLLIQRAQRWVYSPSENPGIQKEFRGECVNLKMEVESQLGEQEIKGLNTIR
jgi:hypothetical protein